MDCGDQRGDLVDRRDSNGSQQNAVSRRGGEVRKEGAADVDYYVDFFATHAVVRSGKAEIVQVVG